LISIFGAVEITFRLTFPEFNGDIHSDQLTHGKFRRYSKLFGYQVRSFDNKDEVNISPNEKVVLVLGDSISDGFGHSYHDIWWSQLERLLKIKDKNYKFISISGFGNNFTDNIDNGVNLISKLERANVKPYKIIYQFNYNDIQPYRKIDLKKINNISKFEIDFAKWRYGYLNKSVAARVIQHYAGILRKETSGSCDERSLDALGAYTWSFGSKNEVNNSEKSWLNFSKNVSGFHTFLSNRDIKFEIMISPILYQIDQLGLHPNYNHLNLDFSCATIDPHKKLIDISSTNFITIYDATNYLRTMFENKIKDNNFEPFYFNADDNHITPLASGYIAEFIAIKWID